MSKAYIEFDLPDSCSKCKLSMMRNRYFGDGKELYIRYCVLSNRQCSNIWSEIDEYDTERASWCELKIKG